MVIWVEKFLQVKNINLSYQLLQVIRVNPLGWTDFALSTFFFFIGLRSVMDRPIGPISIGRMMTPKAQVRSLRLHMTLYPLKDPIL